MVLLTAVQNIATKSNLTLECHKTLSSIGSAAGLVLIPVHGIRGKGIADDRTKLEVEQPLTGSEIAVGISYTHSRRKLDST